MMPVCTLRKFNQYGRFDIKSSYGIVTAAASLGGFGSKLTFKRIVIKTLKDSYKIN